MARCSLVISPKESELRERLIQSYYVDHNCNVVLKCDLVQFVIDKKKKTSRNHAKLVFLSIKFIPHLEFFCENATARFVTKGSPTRTRRHPRTPAGVLLSCECSFLY